MSVRTRFVGVGVGDYDDPAHQRLEHAVTEVRDIHRLLGGEPGDKPLINPTEAQVQARLRSLYPLAAGEPLVLMWSGHGLPSPAGGLRLLTSDSGTHPMAGMSLVEVVGSCAASGANQLLVILDTCFSGEGVPSATDVAVAMMELHPPDAQFAWVGVLASCLRWETARDGVFGERLHKLIAAGPLATESRRPWSEHNQFLRGDHICDALRREWDTDVQRPAFRSDGLPDWLIPNPLYVGAAPAQVVEHLLLAARSSAGETRSWFTGRTAEVDTVVAWVSAAEPGLRVVTGSAGTGKSAIVGRVVSASNPAERARLREQGAFGHDDPGEGSVSAHAHARGRTADQLAGLLDAQLVHAGVLERDPSGRRNAAQLVGALQKHAEARQPPPSVVIDGLDEARGQAFTIARDLLVRVARFAAVVVSTRELPEPDDDPTRTLIEVLAPVDTLDLDDAQWTESGLVAIRAYLSERLSDKDAAMDGAAVADHLTRTDAIAQQPFLLARLVGDQLRDQPIDTSTTGWQTGVARSIYAAVDADLDRISVPGHRSLPDGVAAAELARRLMIALTWGLGAGFPEEEWTSVAQALGSEVGVDDVGADDVSWILEQLGRYIVQDGEAGVAVYRIAHQSLADHFRPAFVSAHQQPFDPASLPVTRALLERYSRLLAAGVAPSHPTYLWWYAWWHAALAGQTGLTGLRQVADRCPALRRDLAMAALKAAETYGAWGYHSQATLLTQEAVALYRALVADHPALMADLAEALNNLGVRLADLGQLSEALTPAEESVALRRTLAADDPAMTPALATSLNNLGNRLADVGRRAEALQPAQEAVDLRREQAAANPAFRSDLANALNNLGNRLTELGRHMEALPPSQEALDLRRRLVVDNPSSIPNLASALNNLGTRLSDLGRRAEALSPSVEAVDLYRRLAAENPAFLPDLAAALNNLGIRYSDLGRPAEGLPVTQEAVDLRRRLSADNPSSLPGLAAALNNLGCRYAEVGRHGAALPPTQEAVELRRELVAGNPAFIPNLATALNNLGGRYAELGRLAEALPPTQEAVELLRGLAATNRAFQPTLAGALSNLGLRLSALGRHVEADPPARESVDQYRELAAVNPAFLPDLAGALNNLGVHYSNCGYPADALPPTQEAVELRRQLSAANRAFIPNLAGSLNNLGVRYSELQRPSEALPPTEEALQLNRSLAAENPAFVPNLAGTLNNLGVRYAEVQQYTEALAVTQEAVDLYRTLREGNRGFTADLASALNNLGLRYSEAGQFAAAIPPSREAVDLLRGLVAENAVFITELARALANLVERFSELSTPDRGEIVRREVVRDMQPHSVASLLLHLSRLSEVGAPQAAEWLADAVDAGQDADVVMALRNEVRRRRQSDPAGFDAAWLAHSGRHLPPWGDIDADLLAKARAWIAAPTFTAEHDHLVSHPELLDESADNEVEEALLAASAAEANRYQSLRQTSRAAGIDAAYRTLLLDELARQFAYAIPSEQRDLLRDRREVLLSDEVAAALDGLPGADEDSMVVRAKALLALVADPALQDVVDGLLHALEDPRLFSGLLQQTARRHDPDPLSAVALCALSAASTREQAGEADLYIAVAATLTGLDDQAAESLAMARYQDPGARDAWIAEVSAIGRIHPKALDLVGALLAPPLDAEDVLP